MTGGKAQPSASRADETRELLIRTAIQLFAAKGVNGVSLRAVGEAAGQKNTAAVHYHFGDRDGLLLEAVDRIMAALMEPVEAALAERVGIDASFSARSAAHAALAQLFLPLLTLPLRHPEWGRDAVKLLSRVITGEAGQITDAVHARMNLHDEQIVDQLSEWLGIADRRWLNTRLDFAFISTVAGLACAEFLSPVRTEERIRDLYLAEVPEFLDFMAQGFSRA